MRLIDADVLKQHIDKLPALPDGNFAGNHSALKALINMQPAFEPSTNCSELPNSSDAISRQAAIDAVTDELDMIDHVPQWVFDRLEKRLKQMPLADVVPVVRCDDCVYYGSRRWCELHSSVFDDNAFCSYGERKE